MKAGAVIIAGIAASFAAWTALAQDRAATGEMVISGTSTSLARQQQALREAKAQAERARALSAQMEEKAESATGEADRLNARAAALAARIQQSEADLRAGQARVAIVNRLIARQQSRLAEKQGPVVRLTAALQSLSRRPPLLALVQPGSLDDAIHTRAVLSTVLPVIEQRTADLRGDLARSRELRSMAVQANAALASSREQLGRQRLALRKLEAEKRLAARNLTSEATLETERATAMGERARDIGDLMEDMEAAGAVRERLAALPGPQLRPAAPGSTAAPSAEQATSGDKGTPPYRLPVVGAIVTGLGEVSDSGVRSRGITIATQRGAQLVAPASGRIAFAGPYRGYGQILIIDHGDGWSSLIANMARLSAAVGQNVAQGAPVGVAKTGDNPTITVELRRQGRPVDIIAMVNAGG